MLRIHRGRFSLTDAEELRIEARDVVEEPAPARHGPTGHARLGVVELVGVPTLGGNLDDRVIAAQQCLPQRVGGVDTSGQPARHANHGNRSDPRLVHAAPHVYEPVLCPVTPRRRTRPR